MGLDQPISCDDVLQSLTSEQGLVPDLDWIDHVANCDSCRDLVDRCSKGSRVMTELKEHARAYEPSAIKGPWQEEGVVQPSELIQGGERSAVTGPRFAMTNWAWITALAACVMILIGWQWATQPSELAAATPARQSTLVWQPVSDGQPSKAGISFLANLDLPMHCFSPSSDDPKDKAPSSDGSDWHWPWHALGGNPHKHFAADCCTTCHQAAEPHSDPKFDTRRLLKSCTVCHVAQTREANRAIPSG